MPKLDIQAAINEAVSIVLADQALRIGAILRSPEADGRREMALTLGLNTTLSTDAALDLLRAAPKENNRRDAFLSAMNAEGRLDLGPAHVAISTDKKAARMAELTAAAKHTRAVRGYGPAK